MTKQSLAIFFNFFTISSVHRLQPITGHVLIFAVVSKIVLESWEGSKQRILIGSDLCSREKSSGSREKIPRSQKRSGSARVQGLSVSPCRLDDHLSHFFRLREHGNVAGWQADCRGFHLLG